MEANADASMTAIVEEVTNQQMASALKAHQKIHILTRAVITDKFYKTKDIAKYAPAAEKICNGNRVLERHLIASLELLCIEKPKNFPVMMTQFYDEDVLDEETILEWATEERTEYTLAGVNEDTRAALRAEAEPVVVWLQEADSDDSDSE